MNAARLTRMYDRLTPQERFRLIYAASARGDEAERDRLAKAGGKISLQMPDHAPWAQAFQELAMLVLLELLEEVALHDEAWERWNDAQDDLAEEVATDDAPPGERPVGDEVDGASDAADTDSKAMKQVMRSLGLYLAQGFVLKTKVAGWRLFCERLSVPLFTVWELLPGYKRLRERIELLDSEAPLPLKAFRLPEMLRWMSTIRPGAKPEELKSKLMRPERYADDLDEFLRTRANWWGA